MAACLVIHADIIADLIEHIQRHFTSSLLRYAALPAKILPILLPISSARW
jgi:hypothetical protein